MSASVVGSAIEIVWGSSQDPAAQDITVPSGATGVYMFYAMDGFNSDGETLASATLAGEAPTNSHSRSTRVGFYPATGVRYWRVSSTGVKSLDISWSSAPSEGPVCAVIFTQDEVSTGWSDVASDHDVGTTAVSATVNCAVGDLILKFDQRYDTGGNPPVLTSGWTSRATNAAARASENFRLSSIIATGTTQVCASENEDYSSIVGVTIQQATASSTVVNPLSGRGGAAAQPLAS